MTPTEEAQNLLALVAKKSEAEAVMEAARQAHEAALVDLEARIAAARAGLSGAARALLAAAEAEAARAPEPVEVSEGVSPPDNARGATRSTFDSPAAPE